jgi:hypothetical protein
MGLLLITHDLAVVCRHGRPHRGDARARSSRRAHRAGPGRCASLHPRPSRGLRPCARARRRSPNPTPCWRSKMSSRDLSRPRARGSAAARRSRRRRRESFDLHGANRPRAGRRIRLRQVHADPRDPGARPGAGRRHPAVRPVHPRRDAPPGSGPDAGGVPGPLRQLQPALAGAKRCAEPFHLLDARRPAPRPRDRVAAR